MTDPKILEPLQAELTQLGQRVGKFAVFSSFVLLLMFLTLSRAYGLISNDAVIELLDRGASLQRSLPDHEIALPDAIELFNRDIFDAAVANHAAIANAAENKPPPLDSAGKKRALTEMVAISDSLAKLEGAAGRQLSLEYPLFGVKLPLDLKSFAVILPFVFVLSALYLFILVLKYQAVLAVAHARVREIGYEALPDSARLRFGSGSRPSSFSRHPFSLQAAVYMTAVFAFFVWVGHVSQPVFVQFTRKLREEDAMVLASIVPVFQLFILSVIYACVVGRRVSRMLHREVKSAIAERQLVAPAWELRWLVGLRRLRRSWGARLCLPAGSSLVLWTLGLSVAITSGSCGGGEPQTGLSLLSGNARWFTSQLFIGGEPNEILNALGTAVYRATIVLAVAGLVIAAVRVFRPRIHVLLSTTLSGVAVACLVFVVVDFALSFGFWTPMAFWPKVVFWIAPAVIAYKAGVFRRRPGAGIRARHRALLAGVYGPLVISAMMFVALIWIQDTDTEFGFALGVYLIGCTLMAIGFLSVERTSPATLRQPARRWYIPLPRLAIEVRGLKAKESSPTA